MPVIRLMGKSEAARCLGVSLQYLWHLRHHDPDFPEPLAILRCGTIWDADQMEDYAASRNRIPGRKKKSQPKEN